MVVGERWRDVVSVSGASNCCCQCGALRIVPAYEIGCAGLANEIQQPRTVIRLCYKEGPYHLLYLRPGEIKRLLLLLFLEAFADMRSILVIAVGWKGLFLYCT